MNKNYLMVAAGGRSVYYGVTFPKRTGVFNVSIIFAVLGTTLIVRVRFRHPGVII